jgi:hypothetical protein
MRINKIFFSLLAVTLCSWGAETSLRLHAAEAERTVQDSMKRFSVKVPVSWQAVENAEGNTLTITGEEAAIVISPFYRENNLELAHTRMALNFAYRSVDGPPKKNKIHSDKRAIGNKKALYSTYDIKSGGDDKHEKYRAHIYTVDGEKHKFSIVITVPLELVNKDDLEARLIKVVESFTEQQ